MHVLQFSQSIDSPSEIYVAFQGDPLLCPSLSPRQEGHCDTRVSSQMPSDPPQKHLLSLARPTSIATAGQSERASIKYHTPNLNYQQRPLSSFLLAIYFFSSSIGSKCKSPEQMRWKRLEEKRGRWRGGEAERTRRKRKKKHKSRTKQPSWCTFATASQWSHPVFVRVRVNKTLFEVWLRHCTVASLRPLLSPCKNVLGDYRKCYRLQS